MNHTNRAHCIRRSGGILAELACALLAVHHHKGRPPWLP